MSNGNGGKDSGGRKGLWGSVLLSPHCPFVPTGQQACGVGTERENGEVFGGGQSTQIFPSYESINYFTLGPVTFQWPLANHFAWKPKR